MTANAKVHVVKQATSFDLDFYRQIIDTIQDGVFVLEDERFVLFNQSFLDMLGYEEDEILGCQFQEFLAEEYRELLTRRYQMRHQGKDTLNEYDVAVHHASGVQMMVHLKVESFTDRKGQGYNVGTLYDVTPERELMTRLKESEHEFKQIIQNLPDIFYRTDASGLVTMASPYASQVLGYDMEEMIGQPLAQFYADPQERADALARIMEKKGEPAQVESHLRCKSGATMWVATSAYARYNGRGEFMGVEGIARNITKRKEMEEQLREMAVRDPLTRLMNRFGFDEHLSTALNRVRRHQGKLAIVFIDLNDFKMVNDRFGHDTGDAFLVKFGQRLTSHFRDTDIVARIGGDEFVVLLDDTSDLDKIDELLGRLQRKMAEPVLVNEHLLSFHYSVGTAIYPDDGLSSSELLKRADRNMYKNKKNQA